MAFLQIRLLSANHDGSSFLGVGRHRTTREHVATQVPFNHFLPEFVDSFEVFGDQLSFFSWFALFELDSPSRQSSEIDQSFFRESVRQVVVIVVKFGICLLD